MSGENPTPQDSEVNPADIEAALNAADAVPEAGATPPVDVPAEEAARDNGSTISQADIDAAMQGAATDEPPPLDSTGQPYDDAAAMMAAAIAEEHAAATVSPGIPAMPLDLPSFNPASDLAGDHKIGLLNDVELDVKIELGRASMLIEEVLRLGEGSVVELDKLAGDPVDVLVNGRLVARGEVLVLNDNFCVRISEILAGNDAEAA
ncbi:MAG: flagellar motor switch protein FliN [Planctomycetota bacterium]